MGNKDKNQCSFNGAARKQGFDAERLLVDVFLRNYRD